MKIFRGSRTCFPGATKHTEEDRKTKDNHSGNSDGQGDVESQRRTPAEAFYKVKGGSLWQQGAESSREKCCSLLGSRLSAGLSELGCQCLLVTRDETSTVALGVSDLTDSDP